MDRCLTRKSPTECTTCQPPFAGSEATGCSELTSDPWYWASVLGVKCRCSEAGTGEACSFSERGTCSQASATMYSGPYGQDAAFGGADNCGTSCATQGLIGFRTAVNIDQYDQNGLNFDPNTTFRSGIAAYTRHHEGTYVAADQHPTSPYAPAVLAQLPGLCSSGKGFIEVTNHGTPPDYTNPVLFSGTRCPGN